MTDLPKLSRSQGRQVRRKPSVRIAVVTSHQYPMSIGGEETFLKKYCEFLRSREVPFVVVSSALSSQNPHLEPLYIRPFSLPLVGYEMYSLFWASLAALKIIKLHARGRLSIVHSMETGYGGLAAVFAARLLHLPLIVHSHGARSEGLAWIRRSMRDWRAWPYYALERSIDRYVASQATKVIAVSAEVSAFLQSLGVPSSLILIAPSAIAISDYLGTDAPKLREEASTEKSAFVIGYLGRLERMKGVEILLDAYAKFAKKSSRSTRLLIGGDGPIRDDLVRQAAETHLSSVRFLGYQSDPIKFLTMLDVFVLPSFFEGSPMVLLEAMATGLPVIASDIRGVREIANDSVLLFPPGDSAKLAELLQLLENDSELRDNLSATARASSLRFSTDEIFPKILSFCLDP